MTCTIPTNDTIAKELRHRAATMAQSGENLYRVRALRQAAMAILMLPMSVASIYKSSGRSGLESIPGVGPQIAEAIVRWSVGETG